MKRALCPITKKVFDCQKCTAIVDGEKCPFMVRDEIAEKEFEFVRRVIEKEMNEK
jgi:RNA polymerase subunit RPABC4/transcription elongation factor Spt4